MIVFPGSKINLGLNITGKRGDGYHNIETIFYPVGLRDALEVIRSPGGSGKDTLRVTGLALNVSTENNLIFKAVQKLRQWHSFPALMIHLHKIIPSGSGLGGGSSDASFTLKVISRLFDLDITVDNLKEIALQLGSDCPFFIESLPSHALGRGEILEPVDHILKGYHIVILNPGIKINTREAFEKCIPVMPETNLKDLVKRPVSDWKNLIKNDFEKILFPGYPVMENIKKTLYHSGCIYSSMTGSGSSVYGIFAARPKLSDKLERYVIFSGLL